jgi:hypothetical protein
LEELFEQHAPETLMAFFGAATSLLLFYLIGSLLNHLFGWQRRSADLEAGQEKMMAALVRALVTEAGHLRETLDTLLDESLQRSERNTQLLAALLAQTEKTPGQVLDLLKPEFAQMHHALRRSEARFAAHLGGSLNDVEEKQALAELVDWQAFDSAGAAQGGDQLTEPNKSVK